MTDRYILGLSAFYHDSAACLLCNGEIIAAAQEERFTCQKGDASFPINALQYCLSEAGISESQLDYVGFYDKPLLKFERILETYLGIAPRGFRQFMKAGPVWIKDKLFIDWKLRKNLTGFHRPWCQLPRSVLSGTPGPAHRSDFFRRHWYTTEIWPICSLQMGRIALWEGLPFSSQIQTSISDARPTHFNT